MADPLDRFKKRKAAPATAWLSADDANALDADIVGAVLGVAVCHQGRHLELANGIRGTNKDGHLVWCNQDGTGIGDNLALVQHVTGLTFRPALELLMGESAARPKAATLRPIPTLRLPGEAGRDAGRAYLAGRGIRPEALATAEACGMLRYCQGAVLFVGYDDTGKPRSATRRGYLTDDVAPKRDLAGSDKAWPAIIKGSDESTVWIVEGGADALALFTIHPYSSPSVIVTGGINVVSWLENPIAVGLIARACRVVIAGEREKDAETQRKTDALREKLRARLAAHRPDVSIWVPPTGTKDLAESLTSAVTLISGSKSKPITE